MKNNTLPSNYSKKEMTLTVGMYMLYMPNALMEIEETYETTWKI